MKTTDLVERVARAIWTAPITGQPEGHEVRQWPPKHPDAMTETLNQSKAAIEAYESALEAYESALQARVEKLEEALAAAADVMSAANYEGYFDSDIADARAALAEDYCGIVEVNEEDFRAEGERG